MNATNSLAVPNGDSFMTNPSKYVERQSYSAGNRRAPARFHPSGGSLSRPEICGVIAEARHQGRNALDEFFGKKILAAYGIDVPRSARIVGPEQLDDVLHDLTPPLVLKVISPDILHKSDAGGVRLNLANIDAVRVAMDNMRERVSSQSYRIEGYLLEEMMPIGHDVVIGGIRDPSFGPLVMFGLGGIFVEVLRDVSFRICPIARVDAAEMIHELRGAPILAGARGGIAVPESMLIDALMAVGGEDGLLLGLADELMEVDINPFIVSNTRAVAVDARFVLTK